MTNGHDFMPVTAEDDVRCFHCDAKPWHRAGQLPCEHSPLLDAQERDGLEDKKAALSSLIQRRFG